MKKKNKNKFMNEDEKAEEATRGKGEAELAPEPTNAGTRYTKMAAPPKEGFFRFPLSTGSLQTGETSEQVETPVDQARRTKKRKTGGSSEFSLELAEEMRTSTTAGIGAELRRRASELAKVVNVTSCAPHDS